MSKPPRITWNVFEERNTMTKERRFRIRSSYNGWSPKLYFLTKREAQSDADKRNVVVSWEEQ